MGSDAKPETCWICGLPKGQPPGRCNGHYSMPFEAVGSDTDNKGDAASETAHEVVGWVGEDGMAWAECRCGWATGLLTERQARDEATIHASDTRAADLEEGEHSG